MVFYSLWFYLEKTMMPKGLSPLYELPARVDLLDRQFLLPAIGVTAITAAVLALRRRWPAGLAVLGVLRDHPGAGDRIVTRGTS